jgi:hypothetical protein
MSKQDQCAHPCAIAARDEACCPSGWLLLRIRLGDALHSALRGWV